MNTCRKKNRIKHGCYGARERKVEKDVDRSTCLLSSWRHYCNTYVDSVHFLLAEKKVGPVQTSQRNGITRSIVFFPHHLHAPWNPRTGSFCRSSADRLFVRRRLQRLAPYELCNDTCTSLSASSACFLRTDGWQWQHKLSRYTAPGPLQDDGSLSVIC